MGDHFDEFDDEIMDETQMPEQDDDLDFDQSEDEDIPDEFEDFTPNEELEIDSAQTAILGGMVFGLAYEDALDRRDDLRPKNKK